MIIECCECKGNLRDSSMSNRYKAESGWFFTFIDATCAQCGATTTIAVTSHYIADDYFDKAA